MESETNKQKVIFELLDYTVDHYDRKDLVSLIISVDDKRYPISFLIDEYNSIFFPEFKAVDKYGGPGFRFIHEFLVGVRSKVHYYIKLQSYNNNQRINSFDEKEWWQKDKINKNSEFELKKWVSKNSSYLMEYDLSMLINKPEVIEELIGYIATRDSFAKPTFDTFNNFLDEVSHLKQQLKKALEREDYEQAVIIRDQIKNNKSC